MNMFSKVLVGAAKVAPVFNIAAVVAGIGLSILEAKEKKAYREREAKEKKAYREAKLTVLLDTVADVAEVVDVIDEVDKTKDE